MLTPGVIVNRSQAGLSNIVESFDIGEGGDLQAKPRYLWVN